MKQKYLKPYLSFVINIIIVLSVFSISFIVASQPAFAITGQVLDQNGKEYVGATVTMNYNGAITTQQTNSSGYSFADPCPFAQNGQPGSAPFTVTLTVPNGYFPTTPTSGNATGQRTEFLQPGTGCGQMMVNGKWEHYPTTSTPATINFGITNVAPNCTSTPINCSACSAPANTCSNGNGTQTCTLSQPQTCSQVTISQSCTINNCNAGSNCVNQACQVITYSISGNVSDNNNANVANVTVSTGGKTTTTDANGNYTITNLAPASYTVSMTIPSGYIPNGATSQAVNLTGNKTGVNFKLTKVVNCTTTPINCSACVAPANTCSNGNGTQTCTLSQPATCTGVVVSQSCTLNNCNAGNICTNQVCQPPTYTITGHVFIDSNGDGINNDTNPYTGGITITSSGGTVTTNAAAGTYTISNITAGTYTVTYTSLPSGYFMTYPTNNPISFTVTVGGSCTVNGAKNASCNANNIQNLDFGVHPLYTISGNVFVDLNKNGLIDAGETNYAVKPTITTSQGTVTTNANGSYTITNLPQNATVTVSYTSLPAGYSMTSPIPPSFQVIVGSSCSTNGAPGASCTNGNVLNLNFGITNTNPWYQASCGDIRVDNGISDALPAGQVAITTAASCTTPNIAGIGFTGDTFQNLGAGQISSTGQLAGGPTYPEVDTASSLDTSYASLLAKAQGADIITTNLSTVCTLSSCTLPNNLPHGIYQASGNVTLNAFSFPANTNYVFLINGNLTINGNITVPAGSTALFSTTGNIIVAANTQTLNGWYVAGQSFIVNSLGTCADAQLAISGSVVVNAAGAGGTFQSQRDLCGNDTTTPAVSFSQRLDMILNAPQFLKQQQTISQEIAP